MAAFAAKNMGGMIPRQDPRLLPDNMAEDAWNCDLAAGDLKGLPTPELVVDLTTVATPVLKAYRYPGPHSGDPDAWLPLPSPYSSVVRSPLANDTLYRFYWTNPGEGAFWNTYQRLRAGGAENAPYNLGFIQIDPTYHPQVAVTGGTSGIPQVARSYLVSYVDIYGAESAPSAPSSVISGAPDGTWSITGLPTSVQGSPAGKNYPAIAKLRLYRTITGTTTGAAFYQVADLAYPTAGSYTDTSLDTDLVSNATLESASWAPPPPLLDGLTALAGGMLVGFTGNTVHFCEPDRPHAWPAAYDLSVQYDIVALSVWQNSLMVLTKGKPSTGSGASPGNYSLQEVDVPEPCLARGSVITDIAGVYYASQNGLVVLNYYGMQNPTIPLLTKNKWLLDFKAASIIACRHRSQYLAINGTGTGFILDFAEPRMGVVSVNTFSNATAVWNDPYTGDTYICADKKVYLWDSPNTGALNYRWRGKQFYAQAPVSLGACQISSSPDISNPAPINPSPPALDNGDARLVLPEGVNAVFRLYAGPDGRFKVLEKNLTEPREVFRLPGGFKAFDWQFEIVSRVPIHSVELASTMKELSSV